MHGRPAHPDICVMAEQGPSGNKLQSTVDVRSKREQVLSRYSEFKNTARLRRERLEAARHFQQFRRDADELEAWINEKIQIVSDESYKERTNLQVLMPVPDGSHGRRGRSLAAVYSARTVYTTTNLPYSVGLYPFCACRPKSRSTRPLRQRQQHTTMPSLPSRAPEGP